MRDPADWWKDEPESEPDFSEMLRMDALGRIDVNALTRFIALSMGIIDDKQE